jgi:hypothetical protein
MSDRSGQSWYKIYGFAGKTFAWCTSDTEQRFDAHMADPKNRKRLEDNRWARDSISYTFNKDGFRAEEFNYEPDDSVLFLGCSLTIGIGMRLEDTWAYKVADTLGLRRYNLGVGGGGSDMCFRLAYHWIPLLRPKYVVMLTPHAGRMEIVMDTENLKYIPSEPTHIHENGFYRNWLSHPANADMNRLKSVMGVQTICNGIGVPLVEIPVEMCWGRREKKQPWTPDLIQPERVGERVGANVGRDLMHPGGSWHDEVANRFLDELMIIHK